MRQSPPSTLETTNATFAARVKACDLGSTDQTLIGPQRLCGDSHVWTVGDTSVLFIGLLLAHATGH